MAMMGKFYGDGSPKTDYTLYKNTTGIVWGTGRSVVAGGSRDAWFGNAVSMSKDRWYHVLSTYSTLENSKRVYLDGVLLNQAGLNPKNPSNNSPLIFGREVNRNFLDGKLDDVRIYDRALSANEIKELYELGNKSSKPAPDVTPPKTGPGDAPDFKCKETIAKLEQEIKNQKIEITDLNILIIELRKQVADLNSSNLALTTEVSGLKNQVNNLNGQVASLTSENGELKGQVTNLREDNGNLQVNVTSLNEQLVESDRIAKTPFVHGWIYTPDHGWLNINPDNFPIIYKNSTKTWHFYEQGSISPRYFYNFNEQKWEAWDSIPSGSEN
jgi:regulator of replication initiation timing